MAGPAGRSLEVRLRSSHRPSPTSPAAGGRMLWWVLASLGAALMVATAPSAAAAAGPTPAPSSSTPASAGTWTWTDRGPTLNAVSCPSATKCVAVGDEGAVLRTTDGGSTFVWSSVPWTAAQTKLGDTLLAVTCSGAQCLAVSSGTNGTSPPHPVSHVYRSTDSGKTWVDTGALPMAAFQTQQASVLGCGSATYCVAAGINGAIWLSTDGGTSWAPVTPAGPQVPYTAIDCPAAKSCVVLSAGGTGSRIVQGKLIAVATPPTGAVTAMSCGSATQCLAVNNASAVFASSDAGANWTQLAQPITPAVHVTDLTCTAATTCVGFIPGGRRRTAAPSACRGSPTGEDR